MNYTLDEIKRIPNLLNKLKDFDFPFSKEKEYLFVGCGSSYNIGFIMKEIMNKNGYKAKVLTGGHVMLFDDIPDSDVAILITRTGESTETVLAAKKLKQKGMKTIGITSSKNSSITQQCEENITLDFAEEKSVVMTGSFVFILAMLLNGIEKNGYYNYSEKILEDSEKIIDHLALEKYEHFVFLGYDENYGISKEGALKLQEMALQYVEYHEPLEYRHGPISRLTENTLVVLNSKGTKEEKKLKDDIEKLGGKVLVISSNEQVEIPDMKGFEAPLRLIPIQYLGYKKALQMGYNPDSPKNLSKSVKLGG
ncbi:MAG: Sugar isomerase (SIS) [Petrotoga mobilis]|nr:MAG: Sugar isomerase (SIS) [Petrotoga mobilis]